MLDKSIEEEILEGKQLPLVAPDNGSKDTLEEANRLRQSIKALGCGVSLTIYPGARFTVFVRFVPNDKLRPLADLLKDTHLEFKKAPA